MSLNSIIPREYSSKLSAILSLLEEYLPAWSGAQTVESRLLVEAEAVSVFQRLIDLTIELEDIKPGNYPDFVEYQETYQQYKFLLKMVSAKINTLMQLFLSYFNSQQVALMELEGLIQRIKQKRATLETWDKTKANYVIAEHFRNFDHLSNNFATDLECAVHSEQGFLTLPIRNTISLAIRRAVVGSASNGIPGNSDIAVQTNNLNVSNILDGDSGTWFEYERLDAGPIKLVLNIELSKTQFVNSLDIEPIALGLSKHSIIEDIVFGISAGSGVSIKDLLPDDVDSDFYVLKPSLSTDAWTAVFLPVEAKNISIILKQDSYESIQMINDSGETVLRNRYPIAIRRVTAKQIEFEPSGTINSKEIEIRSGLYNSVPLLARWPLTSKLYDIKADLSFDGGATWQTADVTQGTETLLMNGSETSTVWRLRVQRLEAAFSEVTDYNDTNAKVLDTNSILRIASPFESPSVFTLPQRPLANKVIAVQPKVCRRGRRFELTRIADNATGLRSVDIPFEISDPADISKLKVYVSGQEFTRVDIPTDLTDDTWLLSDDFKRIIFDTSFPANSDVGIVLDSEIMFFEERSDGYYHQFKFLFDPDKNNIKVKYLPRNQKKAIKLLPRNKTIINLGYKNIIPGTINVSGDTVGFTYTELATKADLFDPGVGAQDYWVDTVNGILYLANELDFNSVKIDFRYLADQPVDQSAFDVVFNDDGLPWGIRIQKDLFTSVRVIDSIGTGPASVLSIFDGTYTSRSDVLSTALNAKLLTQDCIVRGTLTVGDNLLQSGESPIEIPYVDGRTEFLGLIPMLNEATTALTTIGTQISFKLAAGSLWYKELGVSFSNTTVFNLERTSVAAIVGDGEYYIADDGTVTVQVGASGLLTADIDINYFYKNPEFNPNDKYSVDYEQGILYSFSSLVAGANITYESACYKVDYDIARTLDQTDYDSQLNTISIHTENLNPVNNLVKIIWVKQPLISKLIEAKNYFSPLMPSFYIRFQ